MRSSTADLVRQLHAARTFDLSHPFTSGMTAAARQPGFRMSLLGRHGDVVRPDGVSAAYEMYVSGTHVGTHMDASCHISVDGQLAGGLDAQAAQLGGRFAAGIETFEAFLCRGLLLDVAALMDVEQLPAGFEVTDEHLQAAADSAGLSVEPGDALLVRTGMGQHFDDADRYLGHEDGVPGVGEAGARWIRDRGARYTGSDTSGFDHSTAGGPPRTLPSHAVLLGAAEVNIIENLYLEELAQARVSEFVLLTVPLRLEGATGAPVRPLALAL